MEICEVKLFIAILEKLPPSCRLYVGGVLTLHGKTVSCKN